jgi:thiazole synthase
MGDATVAPVAVTWNGKPAEVAGGTSLRALLLARGIDPERVVVALNREVLPRARWGEVLPAPGDHIEVVAVVAGGAGVPEDDDPLIIAGVRFRSRLICGTGKFADAATMAAAHAAAGTEMVTVAVRYFDLDVGGRPLLTELDPRRYRLLPNTAGAYTAADAVHMAELARAATGSNWIKLEVIGDRDSLWPDVAATVEACRELVRRGFVVLPYTSPDPVAAVHLEEAGAATVMPLGSPIGSGQGVLDVASIRRIVRRVHVPVVVDAGIGSPADAALAMEAGASAVLVNTAIAQAQDPVVMAHAMRLAVQAGRLGYLAGRIPRREEGSPSTTTVGVPRVE